MPSRRTLRLFAPLGLLAAVACGDSASSPSNQAPGGLTPANLVAPAAPGELWACKFSVDPVTRLPNPDATSGAISATITTGDGSLAPNVSGGNTATIGYNAGQGIPQCVKVWSDGTSATVAVTEDPDPGSGLLFYRLVRREAGATSDDIYFESANFTPPSEGPVTVSVDVTNGAAYEVWFKNVKVEEPPPPSGCTYTQGFWKTHSDRGPAPYSDGWQAVGPDEEDTAFFNSGQTWYEVFWTAPRGGNAFYILAHQYMAAKLNVLNGAGSTDAVDDALAGAEALFAGLAAGSTTLATSQRTDALAWASTLDSYNNGVIGPGHCE